MVYFLTVVGQLHTVALAVVVLGVLVIVGCIVGCRMYKPNGFGPGPTIIDVLTNIMKYAGVAIVIALVLLLVCPTKTELYKMAGYEHMLEQRD